MNPGKLNSKLIFGEYVEVRKDGILQSRKWKKTFEIWAALSATTSRIFVETKAVSTVINVLIRDSKKSDNIKPNVKFKSKNKVYIVTSLPTMPKDDKLKNYLAFTAKTFGETGDE